MGYMPPGAGVPRKGTNPLVWVFAALVGFCCIGLISLGFMTATVFNQTSAFLPCVVAMQAGGDAMREFVKEKGVFPRAESWQSDIAPFYEKQVAKVKAGLSDAPVGLDQIVIPSIEDAMVCNASNPSTWIMFNSELSGRKPSDFADLSEKVALYEGLTGELNAHAPYVMLPLKDSPRMMGSPRGWNLVYADGAFATTSNTSGRRTRIRFEQGEGSGETVPASSAEEPVVPASGDTSPGGSALGESALGEPALGESAPGGAASGGVGGGVRGGE